MRIAGKEISGPAEEVLILPRLDGDIVIRAKAVLDFEEFDALCKAPTAPQVIARGGRTENFNDPDYLRSVQTFSELRLSFLVLKSLEPSQIEWDTVKANEPKTWKNWETDLRKAGFSGVEVQRITTTVLAANSLDELKLKKAREDFLRGLEEAQQSSSGPQTEPPSM